MNDAPEVQTFKIEVICLHDVYDSYLTYYVRKFQQLFRRKCKTHKNKPLIHKFDKGEKIFDYHYMRAKKVLLCPNIFERALNMQRDVTSIYFS